MQKMTLRTARVSAEMTQSEVADKLGVSRNTYNNYESYTTAMRIDKAIAFTKIVSVDFDDIIFLNKNYT